MIASAWATTKYAGWWSTGSVDVLARYDTPQPLLECHEVVFTCVALLAAKLELFAGRCECWRAFPMTLSMVQASALLHQALARHE